jgi:hypothetical protein
MNRVAINLPMNKPFPIVPLATAISVALGASALIGVILLGGIGGARKPSTVATAPYAPATPAIAPGPTEEPSLKAADFKSSTQPTAEERLVGTWTTQGMLRGQPCTCRLTFGPTTTYSFTLECILADGTIASSYNGSYTYFGGQLDWNVPTAGGFSGETVTWPDDNHYVSRIVLNNDPSMVGHVFTATRQR